jgi:ATP-dependent DNA helicase PIF1
VGGTANENSRKRAILCSSNKRVREIKKKAYLGCDTGTMQTNNLNGESDTLYQTELVSRLMFPRIPCYKPNLKVGIPVMLIRNTNQSVRLCNGTRMAIIQLGRRFPEAQIIPGTHVGED